MTPPPEVLAQTESAAGWPPYRWWQSHVVGSVDQEQVVARIFDESGWSPRYAFMTMMSAGIAILGLLLSSPAVVIGAMLISPLMNPILGLGFSLALFDFTEMRRALLALVIGAGAALLFSALIVLFSPLKAATPEILSRTRPNLFDLLVALFAALAGTFAIIRGRGETIVGVAIATALMPPIAVVGYGLATWNVPVLEGALALFVTNFVTIALSATIMARYYGFGHSLSSHQSWAQTIMLVIVFVVMAIPLAISLRRIAGEALTVAEVRSFLSGRFGDQSRLTQLDVDFERKPMVVRAVVIAPRDRAIAKPILAAELAKELGRPATLRIDEVLLSPGAETIDRQRVELKLAESAQAAVAEDDTTAKLVALAAGVAPDAVTIDQDRHRAIVQATVLPGASLATYFALEHRVASATAGWDITIVPPVMPLPTIAFPDGVDALDDAGRQAVRLSAWAARRWNAPGLSVPGLPSAASEKPRLAERRALAIAAILKQEGIATSSAPAEGQKVILSTSPNP